MGHAAHFICGNRCRFHLATYVGKFIVSTVGELPELGKDNNNFQEIGFGRLYETYVFKAIKSKNKCCPYEIIVSEEIDAIGANTADKATKNHFKLCNKWSKK